MMIKLPVMMIIIMIVIIMIMMVMMILMIMMIMMIMNMPVLMMKNYVQTLFIPQTALGNHMESLGRTLMEKVAEVGAKYVRKDVGIESEMMIVENPKRVGNALGIDQQIVV